MSSTNLSDEINFSDEIYNVANIPIRGYLVGVVNMIKDYMLGRASVLNGSGIFITYDCLKTQTKRPYYKWGEYILYFACGDGMEAADEFKTRFCDSRIDKNSDMPLEDYLRTKTTIRCYSLTWTSDECPIVDLNRDGNYGTLLLVKEADGVLAVAYNSGNGDTSTVTSKIYRCNADD
jgi:hypothetical protein